MNKLLLVLSIILNLVSVSYGACEAWSEWVGDCRLQFCGECNTQQRTRTCTEPTEATVDKRNCYNALCLFPCPACEANCKSKIIGKQFGCVAKPVTTAYASDIAPVIPQGATAHSNTCPSSKVTVPPPLNVG